MIAEYQRLASSIVLNSDAPPDTLVSDDGMSITHGLHTLHIAELRSGIEKMGQELESELNSLTYGLSASLELPDSIPDDWRDNGRGVSWTKNHEFMTDELCVLGKMLQDPSLRLSVVEEGRLKMDSAGMWGALAKFEQFEKKLAVYTFLTAGQPPRGTEFMDHKFANSTRARTTFFQQLTLWLVTRRTKMENRLRKEFFIPMKCHPQLTFLLTRYLLLLRPVETHLAYHLQGDSARHVYSEYLWVHKGRRMVAEDLYRIFPEVMVKYCNFSGGLRDYRQIAVEIGRIFLGTEADVQEEGGDKIAAQTGHTLPVARAHYAVEYGTLPSLSTDAMRRFAKVSESWWAVLGCHPTMPPLLPLDTRRGMENSRIPGLKDVAGRELDVEGLVDAIVSRVTTTVTSKMTHDIQQLRTVMRADVRETVAEVMALGVGSGPGSARHQTGSNAGAQEDLIATERVAMDGVAASSVEDSRILDAGEGITTEGVVAATISSRHGHSISEYLLHLLRQHFPGMDPPAQFKSQEQQEAVYIALQCKINFAAVLRTGDGKSLCFTLPPFNEPGFLTFVVIPNKALLTDQIAKAEKAKLKCQRWTSAHQNIDLDTQLVFFALESIISAAFKR